MPATVAWKVDNGGTNGNPATSTDVDALGPPALQMRSDDATQTDDTADILKPAAGTNYSYVKSNYLECISPPDTQIDNVQFYTDGNNGFGTGYGLVIGNELPTRNSGATTGYRVATGTPGVTGDEMVAGPYNGVITGVTNAFSFIQGAAKAISISEAGGIIDAAGETTNYFVLQLTVASIAVSKTLPNETATLQYDEV